MAQCKNTPHVKSPEMEYLHSHAEVNLKKKERKKNRNFGSEYNSGLLKVENLIYSCDVLQERMDVLKYLLWKHL